MESYLEIIRELRSSNYTMDDLDDIADGMEDIIGSAEMWDTLRHGFEPSEFLENLEYIARECDL